MAINISRRKLIAALGGTATAWPLVARAQQPAMRAIGFLRSTSRAASEYVVAAFREGLKEAGFDEDRNVVIEFRYADDQIDRLPPLVAELIHWPVEVIVGNVDAALAAKHATTTVPIVFATGSDPVTDGLVASLNRPDANVTGVSFVSGALGAKRLQMLRQLVPTATTMAMMVEVDTHEAELELGDVKRAAQAVDQKLIILEIAKERDLETAFETIIQSRVSALLVGSGPFLASHRERLVALAAQYAIPAFYSLREFVVAGGLMSYGATITDAYRQVGIYAGRILKGEKPADLPVMQPTKFELVINLKTAKALALTVPPDLLATADEVIE